MLRNFALLGQVASRFWRDLDPKLIEAGHLNTHHRQIENFKYWHDRLDMLKQIFDELEPSSLGQWWVDRGKRVQRLTFGVAILVLILTVVFGIIQSIEGGIQSYYTVHQKGCLHLKEAKKSEGRIDGWVDCWNFGTTCRYLSDSRV